MTRYFWVTGTDKQGTPTTAGPYGSAEQAEDATAHLRNTQVHVLHTRQHDLARRALRERLQGGGGGGFSSKGGGSRGRDDGDFGDSMAADEPISNRPGLVQRFRDLMQPKRQEEDNY